jgi:hypothetical protein
MILKTLTHDHGSSDVWNYYDNISSASVYYDEGADEMVVSMSSDDYEGSIVLAITEVAYLLNDKGQTIDRIVPVRKHRQEQTEPLRIKALISTEIENK